MTRIFCAVLMIGFATFSLSSPASAASQESTDSCQALAGMKFSDIPDAPTQINEARVIKSVRELIDAYGGKLFAHIDEYYLKNTGPISPYCRVVGYVAPQVGFELMLPVSGWNGKFLHIGCGGWCGSTVYQALKCAQYPGYACVGTDMGHKGEGGLWLRNNLQGQIDFSYRATHVTTLAAKAITEKYYAKPPARSYFMGCSTGGYQAMVEAQRFPWDFNGIVAGAPDMDESELAVRGVWIKQNFMGKGEHPTLDAEALKRVHEQVLAQCDRDDGVKDGLVSDPAHCKPNLDALACKSGQSHGCLSEAQRRAVANIYGRPVTSNGIEVAGRGMLPGSELDWEASFKTTWGDVFFEDTGLLSVPGKKWNYQDFDFDRDYQRSGSGVLFPDTNPDLGKFKAAGGKLLIYQGANDTAETPGAMLDYYETVERTMGGRQPTQDFARLFVIPGMSHCTGGNGVFAFDYLSYLENWVEHGKAPQSMVGAHVSGIGAWEGFTLKYPLAPETKIDFTRPVYPYPQHAKYKGKGDQNKAESFEAASPR